MTMQLPMGPTLTTGGAAQMFRLPGGGMGSSSSFGIEADQRFSAAAFIDSPRCRELRFRRSFYDCTQHDHKIWDFDGNVVPSGPAYTHAGRQVVNGPQGMFIPWPNRRPVAPVRLLKTIVRRFTALIFGEKRFPLLRSPGDAATAEFAEGLAKEEELHQVMKLARDIGGSVGTVGLSWRFYKGKPRVLPHDGCNLHVHRWADREARIPAHVTEVYLFEKLEWNPKKQRDEMMPYWSRRDWTPEADVVFRDAPVNKEEPIWKIDEEQSFEHRDGFCHFVWVQNTPATKVTDFDGDPDYGDAEEMSNALDLINSITVRGGIKNLDPTLMLKMKEQAFNRGVRKGSDNALLVGENGSAQYLELGGSSLTAGIDLVMAQRRMILEAAECVIPDPDQLTAAGMSSVAIAALYAPMISSADDKRVQYGRAIKRLLEQQIESYRMRKPKRSMKTDAETGGEVEVIEGEFEVDEETGAERVIEPELDLPPKVIEEEEKDEAGNPTGNMTTTIEVLEPGESKRIEMEWPPYFPPSDADRQQRGSALTIANGGKPLMSQRSSVEQFVIGTPIQAADEWQRIVEQQRSERGSIDAMYPAPGQNVPAVEEAKAAEPAEQVAEDAAAKAAARPDVTLTPTAQAQMITVDEARASRNLPPHPDKKIGAMNFAAYTATLEKTSPATPEQPAGIEDVMMVNEMRARATPPLPPLPSPDGEMTLTEFKAARAARGQARGAIEGESEGQAIVAEATPPEPAAEPAAAPPEAPPVPGAPPPPGAPEGVPEGQPGAPAAGPEPEPGPPEGEPR